MLRLCSSLCLLVAAVAAIPKNLGDSKTEKRPGGVAPKPLYRDPVYDGAADPTLIWDQAGKRWIMFYTNRRANVPNLPGVSWVHGTRIGMAESKDFGVTWKYIGTANVKYGRSDYTQWAPEVIRSANLYHMYLSIVPGTFDTWNAPSFIIHLTSRDLKDWTYEATLALGSDRVIDPCVIQLADGTWRMWFKNERAKDGSIYYADSPDLYHWAAKGVALPGSRGEGPKVFRWKGVYWLVFDVWEGLGVYHSDDCLHWIGQSENLVQVPGTLPTDRTKGNHPDVVESSDGRAYLFYFTHQLGLDAENKPPDWTRHTVIQVAELELVNGVVLCNRNSPVHIDLQPIREQRQ